MCELMLLKKCMHKPGKTLVEHKLLKHGTKHFLFFVLLYANKIYVHL